MLLHNIPQFNAICVCKLYQRCSVRKNKNIPWKEKKICVIIHKPTWSGEQWYSICWSESVTCTVQWTWVTSTSQRGNCWHISEALTRLDKQLHIYLKFLISLTYFKYVTFLWLKVKFPDHGETFPRPVATMFIRF